MTAWYIAMLQPTQEQVRVRAVVFGRWSLKRWSLEWWVRTEVFSDRNRNVELEQIFFISSCCGVKVIFAPESILAPAKEFRGHISTLLFNFFNIYSTKK